MKAVVVRRRSCTRHFGDVVNVRHTSVLIVSAAIALLWIHPLAAQSRSEYDDQEIVAGLTGGRVIVFVAKDKIVFAAVDHPIEKGAAPPRVVDLAGTHFGVLLGASQWRILADPNPIRLDRNVPRFGLQDPRYAPYAGDAASDLETIGEAFLEKLHPLAAKLHHQINFPPDQALLELVVIGYGPQDYGPEVWTVEYRMTQDEISSNLADYWQTSVLRPRFRQLYPPEKHAPHTLVEARYPNGAKGPTLQDLIDGNDPRIASLCSSDRRLAKACELIDKGEAQKVDTNDAVEFLWAALPLVFPNQHFILGTMGEQHGFSWIVPPAEPVEKAQRNTQQPYAPTLRRRPDSP